MYPEFIAIYIGLGMLLILQITTIILTVLLYKKSKKAQESNQDEAEDPYLYDQKPQYSGVVFCINCGAQYDAAHKVCPKCGKPR